MAIGTPVSLGTFAPAADTPANFNTTAAVPTGAKIIVVSSIMRDPGALPTQIVSGGGLTWTKDHEVTVASAVDVSLAVHSANAPSGLASGTTLTLDTIAALGTYGGIISVCYVEGLADAGFVDVFDGQVHAAGAGANAWDTTATSTTNADDLVIGGAFKDATCTSTASGGATELHDIGHSNSWAQTTTYKILSATGSQSLTGTFSAGTTAIDLAIFVAYKSGVPAVPPSESPNTWFDEEGFISDRWFDPEIENDAWFDPLMPSGPPAVTGSAALSGAGALVASGTKTVKGVATLSGSGALTSSGKRTHSGSATLAGAGALAATGARTVTGSASLSGSGALTASGVRVKFGSAVLSGSGALTSSGLRTVSGAAALAGAGAIASSGLRSTVGSAALSGSGAITSSGTRTTFGSSALTGVGAITSSGIRSVLGIAVLSGSGTLAATGKHTVFGSATLLGLGQLTASGIDFSTILGSATLSGSGTLTAVGVVGAAPVSGTAALSGSGALTAVGTRIVIGSASLSGSGALAANGNKTVIGIVVLAGSGNLNASGQRTTLGVATLMGLGLLTSSGAPTRFGSASLIGLGTLQASGAVVLEANYPPPGPGDYPWEERDGEVVSYAGEPAADYPSMNGGSYGS